MALIDGLLQQTLARMAARFNPIIAAGTALVGSLQTTTQRAEGGCKPLSLALQGLRAGFFATFVVGPSPRTRASAACSPR